ncbi:MAG TPA: hypothetical protein VGO00_15260 [Kofleriaceae bacterium]|nr:hypothetical protein [Kofleriaceae bacterium]
MNLSHVALALVVSGCNVDADTPSDVVTGIYEITVTNQADDCTAPRFTGTGTVAVFQHGDGIDAFDYTPSSQTRYSLEAAQGYTLQIPADGQKLLACANDPSSSVVFELALTAATAGHFEVDKTEMWTITAACQSVVDSSTVPVSSCHATRTLSYDLVQACDSSCLIADATGALICQCPSM